MSWPNCSSTPSAKHGRKNLRDIREFGSPISRYSDGVERTGLVPITPMPDFKNMDTPEVQKQAQKYGLKKRLAKSKLTTKLKEVYMYTHQISEDTLSEGINDSCNMQESDVDLQDSFQMFQPLDSSPIEKRNDPEIIRLDDIDSPSIVIINAEDEDVSVKEISSFTQKKDESWNLDRIPTLAERIRKSSKNLIYSAAPQNNIDIVVVADCPACKDSEYSSKGVSQPEEENETNATLLLCDSLSPFNRTVETSNGKDIQPGEQDDRGEGLLSDNSKCSPGRGDSLLPEKEDIHKNQDEDIKQIFFPESKCLEDLQTCYTENLQSGGLEYNRERFAFLDSNDNKDVLLVHGDINRRDLSREDEDPVHIQKDVSLMLLSSDSREDVDLIPFQVDHTEDEPLVSALKSNLEDDDGRNSFQDNKTNLCETSCKDVRTTEICERPSAKDSFHGDDDEESFSSSDEDDIVGSDHEELHNSLFVSIHDSPSKQHKSSCSSSDQEEAVYLSLKDRIRAKKGLLQLPDKYLDKLANEELNDTPRKRKKDVKVQICDENVQEIATSKTDKKSKTKRIKLDESERTCAMYNAIISDDFIYTSVLSYEPLYLSQFRKLMDENNIKCSAKDLMDFLDNQGITFSTADERKTNLFLLYLKLAFNNSEMSEDEDGNVKGQAALDRVTDLLEITVIPLDNTKDPKPMRILFYNSGDKRASRDNWCIYMNNLSAVDVLKESKFPETVKIEHVMGGLYKIIPQDTFYSIAKELVLRVHITFEHAMISRYSALPNWYIAQEGCIPRVFKSTTSESLDFVSRLDLPERWKKSDKDESNPFTPRERYLRYLVKDSENIDVKPVLPTPLNANLKKLASINLSGGSWKVQMETDLFKNEAQLLADRFKISIHKGKSKLKSHSIRLRKEKVENQYGSDESYAIHLDDKVPSIQISAPTAAGMFYGIQSLLSLSDSPRESTEQVCLPAGTINDAPRFPYRGLHIDIARNFASASEICKIIKVISMYKMNKLHLHLTDDEGWRLEIKDIPELTEIGGKSKTCCVSSSMGNTALGLALNPMLGSGPDSTTSGSGFYTAKDYQLILKEASKHHVQVIPEIDIPGHSYAAVLALTGRYNKYKKIGNMKAALEYFPVEPNDTSNYESVQKFKRNTLNPCVDGTWRFVEKVITTLKELHAPIQPLKFFHCGGDEVPTGAWNGAPACKSFFHESHAQDKQDSDEEFDKIMTRDIQDYFLLKVKQLCKKHNLQVGVWNDGVRDPTAKQNGEDSTMVYAWKLSLNTEEDNPNILANSGYKVILASSTHLYFDHPYEPDPEENGLHWCVRMIDTPKIFGMKPFNMYSCQETTPEGDHEKLIRRESILGMQAQMWSELCRTNKALEYMLFPRVLAIAERAWHQAPWEDEEEVSSTQTQDWGEFATTVGKKELKRLERLNVMYRVPPPGFNIEGDKLMINSIYPGMKYKYRKVGDQEWIDCRPGIESSNFERDTLYEMVTSSFDGKRLSRSASRKGFREEGVKHRHPSWGPDIPCFMKRK